MSLSKLFHKKDVFITKSANVAQLKVVLFTHTCQAVQI